MSFSVQKHHIRTIFGCFPKKIANLPIKYTKASGNDTFVKWQIWTFLLPCNNLFFSFSTFRQIDTENNQNKSFTSLWENLRRKTRTEWEKSKAAVKHLVDSNLFGHLKIIQEHVNSISEHTSSWFLTKLIFSRWIFWLAMGSSLELFRDWMSPPSPLANYIISIKLLWIYPL